MDEKINEWFHSTNLAGVNQYRPQVKVRKDAFYEYLPDNTDIRDQRMHKNLGNSIVELSDMCFKHCVDAHFKYFTKEE